ncbi:ArgE/DapE family deacylase [Dolosigranulum pigrum]|uniref:ArgE/DapE family deacylase n=1 Tax=Dolosigranulum pigrum TaxID=29394 RepID=UPI000DBFFCB2|nr:ArgE/DapE family deacylase [Dolosigranulum pigrum]QTJ49445.1 ArgE/DapE family deacylase [Dolosigranulum pigrum]RAN55450.1 succinyl-diaminopimelate desuccinylase [Dolosigranulum pigrum]
MDQEQKINILRDVIKIKSINNHEKEVALYYQSLLSKHGIESTIIEYEGNRANLIAEINGGTPGKTLVFNGHMDVVDVSDPTKWTYPPFAAKVVEGKMYGRGTTDMKGGLTALILAFIAIKESNVSFKGTLRFVANLGEEIGMYGSEQLVDEGYLDDVDAFIIAEPSSHQMIITSHKGSLQYEIISEGMAAHSSVPEQGINSISQAMDYINTSNRLFEQARGIINPDLGETINVFTVINGGDQINSVPERTVIKANARIIPEFNNEQTLQLIEQSLVEVNERSKGTLRLNILQNNLPVETPADSDLVHAIHQATGQKIPVQAMMGATDASNFARLKQPFDLAIFGPGDPSRAHAIDEYIEIEDYLSFINIFEATAIHYLS